MSNVDRTVQPQIMIENKWKEISYVVLFSFLTKGGNLLQFQGLGAEKTYLAFLLSLQQSL